MSKANIPLGAGGRQGIKAPSGKPLNVANKGQGTKPFKGVFAKAQVTGVKKGGSSSVTGGKVGKTSKG